MKSVFALCKGESKEYIYIYICIRQRAKGKTIYLLQSGVNLGQLAESLCSFLSDFA